MSRLSISILALLPKTRFDPTGRSHDKPRRRRLIEQVLVADVDGNGRDGVIATGYRSVYNGSFSGDYWMHTSKTWIFSNPGTGSLSLMRTIDHNPHEFKGTQYDEAGAFNAGVGDFDGDGTRDLAIIYSELHYIALHFASGAGGPAAVLNCDVLVNPNGIAVYDWNGDGRDDLAVQGTEQNADTEVAPSACRGRRSARR